MHSFDEANPYQQQCQRQRAWRDAVFAQRAGAAPNAKNASRVRTCAAVSTRRPYTAHSVHDILFLPDLFISCSATMNKKALCASSVEELSRLPPIGAYQPREETKSPLGSYVSEKCSDLDVSMSPRKEMSPRRQQPCAPQTATLNKGAFRDHSIYEINRHPDPFATVNEDEDHSLRMDSAMDIHRLPDVFSPFHDDAYSAVKATRQPSTHTLNKNMRRACSIADIINLSDVFAGKTQRPIAFRGAIRAPSDLTLNKYATSEDSEYQMNQLLSDEDATMDIQERKFRDFSKSSLEDLGEIPPISYSETARGVSPRPSAASKMQYFPGMRDLHKY